MNAGDSMSTGNQGLPDSSGSFAVKPQDSLATCATQGESDESSSKWNDPWALYGGNIAAACRATNESVVTSRQEDTDDDKEKQRQRASNRLTAWQSRERKRIEFEVMQERKAELTRKNAELKKENEQIRLLIRRIKAVDEVGGGSVGVAASRAVAIQRPAMAGNIPRLDTPGGYFYPFQSSHNNNELPTMAGGNSSSQFLFQNFQSHMPGNEMLAPTVFAPITRNHMHASMQLPLGSFASSSQGLDGLEVPYYRTMAPPLSKRKSTETSKPEKRRRDAAATQQRKEAF